MARTPISKKLRFDVFKRDGFACAYCGAHPSETVLLEVDHIHPVVEGGGDDIDNLVTACFACNRGKGAGLLTDAPQSLKDKAAQTIEREAQIRAYHEIMEERKKRRDEELWSVADIFMQRFSDDNIRRSHLSSIRTFLDRLDCYEVQEAMEKATNKLSDRSRAFSYFCGICWAKIKTAEG